MISFRNILQHTLKVTCVFAVATILNVLYAQSAPQGGFFTEPSLDAFQRINQPVYSGKGEIVGSVMIDELTMVLASNRVPGSAGGYDICISTRRSVEDVWGPVTHMPRVNSEHTETYPRMSADGAELFFGSNRPNGLGEMDIYRQPLSPSVGPYADSPENLSEINTEFDDNGAVISADRLVLIWHSDRPGGFGGYDLWMARRYTAAEPFRDVTNLGPLVNSEADENEPTLSNDARTLFFTRHTEDDPTRSEVWMASRPTAWQEFSSTAPEMAPFEEAAKLEGPLNTEGAVYSPYVSSDWPADGSQLYVSVKVDTEMLVAASTWRNSGFVFVRGDCNSDGLPQIIADSVFHLRYLFLGGFRPRCYAACDANADGDISGTADAIYNFRRLLGGPPLPPPDEVRQGFIQQHRATDLELGCENPVAP